MSCRDTQRSHHDRIGTLRCRSEWSGGCHGLSCSGPTVRCNTVGCAEGQTFIATSRRRKFVALVGCHANHVVRRQHHCQRCKRGQLLPRMLCGSTTAFRFGGLPCESRGSQVVPPDAVNLCAAQACPLRASFDAQAAQPSTQLIVVRGRMNRSLLFHFELGRMNRSPFIFQLLGHSCCTATWRYRRQYRQCSKSL